MSEVVDVLWPTKPIDRETFAEILSPISRDTAKPWADDRIEIWYAAFRMFPRERLGRSIMRMKLSRLTWNAEIHNLRLYLAEDYFGVLPDADQAYAELGAARKVWSPYDEDACLKAAAMLGDWTAEALRGVGGFAAAFDSNNEPALRAHFARAYALVIERRVSDQLVPDHLKPRPALSVRKAASLPAAKSRAIASQPAALPAPSPATENYARKLARKFAAPDADRPPLAQTEEEAAAAKAQQIRRLELSRRRA